jgi:hypothetical protein
MRAMPPGQGPQTALPAGAPVFPVFDKDKNLASLMEIIAALFPLTPARRRGLARDVAELSRLLTAGRGDRPGGYLSQPPLLSAYLRYFLPWNVYRLSRILPALPLPLADGDRVTDLGAGPLTLAAALWLYRPELRSLALEFRCVDHAAPALEAGRAIFRALDGGVASWTIKTVRSPLERRLRGRDSALVSAINVYNERYWAIPHRDSAGLAAFARREGRRLAALAAPEGRILIMEPGLPRSAEFIARLREALRDLGRMPRAPCSHAGPCPFPGGWDQGGQKKGKWCHFRFAAQDAPPALRALSAAAGLPKEWAVLSYLLAGGAAWAGAAPSNRLDMRIISGAFALGKAERSGRYACSSRGPVLVAGQTPAIESLQAGSLFSAALPETEIRDPKSGALVVNIPNEAVPR